MPTLKRWFSFSLPPSLTHSLIHSHSLILELTSLQVLCHFSIGAFRAKATGLNPSSTVVVLHCREQESVAKPLKRHSKFYLVHGIVNLTRYIRCRESTRNAKELHIRNTVYMYIRISIESLRIESDHSVLAPFRHLLQILHS